jgi:hypothetical protein
MKANNKLLVKRVFGTLLLLGLLLGALNSDRVQADGPPTFVPSTTAGWNFEGDQANTSFGLQWSPAGDVNGDGFDDLIAGAYSENTANGDLSGQVKVFFGSETGFDPTTPDWIINGEFPGDRLGYSVSSAGDVNGDGFDDVLIGAHWYSQEISGRGKAYLFYGSKTGLSSIPAWTKTGTQTEEYLGIHVTTAGDVNGDGFSDIAISSRGFDNVEPDEGRIYVFHGSSSGLSNTADWMAESNQTGSLFGVWLNSLGDVNGDGFDELAVGAYDYSNGQTGEGAVFVWYGSEDGLNEGEDGTPANVDWMAESNRAEDDNGRDFGARVGTPGDVNGDGYNDIVVSASEFPNPTFAEGVVFLWYGSQNGLNGGTFGSPSNPAWFAESNNYGFAYGYITGKPADVNGDGYGDVIVGCLYYNSGYGAVFAYFGSETGLGASGTLSNSDWMVAAPINYSEFYIGHFGGHAGSVGDANGDGFEDIVIGAGLWKGGVANTDPYYRRGKIWAYYTNAATISGTVTITGNVSITGPISVSAHLDPGDPPVVSADFIEAGDTYKIKGFPAGSYYISAYLDKNNSGGPPDDGEPFAWYDENGDGIPDPVTVELGDNLHFIDIELMNPLNLFLPLILKY